VNPIILIPARMASTRLPDKPMADIAGKPMIVHVWERCVAAGAGDVVVACDGPVIADAISKAGGKAVLTDADLPSGSDRIWQALSTIDPTSQYDVVVNVQGDLPTLDPSLIHQALAVLEDPAVDIATLAAPIHDVEEITDPAVVKPVIAFDQSGTKGRALYFSRQTLPYGEGAHYHHIGLYAYRRKALQEFVALSPSLLEKREKLEQLRALEADMRIGIAVVDAVPLGVDTPETLIKARRWHEQSVK
jgi:3-deoxy-manno-octulosonate cytidylyltransferase (CMP-KDO synthetase)